MEIVERASSFWTVDQMALPLSAAGHTLVRARFSELANKGREALDPDALGLEAPAPDEPLHWLKAEDPAGHPVLVPAQLALLFANLDEPALFSALGSTGLGAGLDRSRARLAGLLECLERDAESVAPFDPARAFCVRAAEGPLAEHLARLEQKGIEPAFEDLTTEFGVPCFRCFVFGPEGQLAKGAAAGLDGPRALVSALTETAYPFPFGPRPRPAPAGLPVRDVEDLPRLSTGSTAGDLALVEAVLKAHGHRPLYVDLTRRDMRLPVVRAIVPGLEVVDGFPAFARVSPRLWANVLALLRK